MRIVRGTKHAGTIFFCFVNDIQTLLKKASFSIFVVTAAIMTCVGIFGMRRIKPGKMGYSVVVVMGHDAVGQ
jgi:hypothetical protein